jgi:hypothetical protein
LQTCEVVINGFAQPERQKSKASICNCQITGYLEGGTKDFPFQSLLQHLKRRDGFGVRKA